MNDNKIGGPVYGRPLGRWTHAVLLFGALVAAVPAARAQSADHTILEAREALRLKDGSRLAAARAAAVASGHPLAMWADYWDLNNRLAEVQQPEVDAFYARWRDTYVEDRLRNDWLLELGKRQDWTHFAADQPHFRMNDDREVACYALLIEHFNGKDVREAARSAWFAQREADEACVLMAATLYEAKRFDAADVWRKARLAVDVNRWRAAAQAAALIGPDTAASVQELTDSPVIYLVRKGSAEGRGNAELVTLALMRMAVSDPVIAANALADRWERQLPPDLAAWAWFSVGKQAAISLLPDALDHYLRGSRLAAQAEGGDTAWPDETYAWKARAALRANDGASRWQQVVQAINAMTPATQRDPAWVYWKARALNALAADSQDSAGLREHAMEMLRSIAGHLHFYGALAAETLGVQPALPPRPLPLTPQERETADQHPGLNRALQLIALGLRNEGVREWNYALRGMADRELLAAAQLACDKEVWDRCINTSDRTRAEVNLEQRFPMPFRRELLARAKEIGLDPAYVYGVIRQESRFVMDARSHAGASGLMQLMPATARWTARKIGLDYTPRLITDRDTNLKLGTSYLKLVLDEFGGSQALAAAAYNAGPGRPRRWREGPRMDPAAWAENIPINETRDYVKKVLHNASLYAALLGGETPSLMPRLGRMIGPLDAGAPAPNADLP